MRLDFISSPEDRLDADHRQLFPIEVGYIAVIEPCGKFSVLHLFSGTTVKVLGDAAMIQKAVDDAKSRNEAKADSRTDAGVAPNVPVDLLMPGQRDSFAKAFKEHLIAGGFTFKPERPTEIVVFIPKQFTEKERQRAIMNFLDALPPAA